MMRVFFYIHTLRPGGAEKQCAMIAADINKRFGYESAVILNWGDGAKPEYVHYLKEAGAEIIVLPRNPVRRLLKLYLIFRANRDAVLFNYLTYPDFVGALVARIAGLGRVVGGFETDRMFGAKMIAEKLSHSFLSQMTIVNSCKAFDFCASCGFNKSRMVIMPSAIKNLPLVKHEVKTPVRIICVGRFVPEKDYITWIDVIATVYAKRKSIEPVIIGYGVQENIICAHIAKKKLEGVIKIMPGQTTNVREELCSSDIYFSSSIQEGTSNTILEAMEVALPVVATNVGDNSIMIEDGCSGYVRETKDISGLTESLLMLIDNPDLRHKFGMRAKEIVMSKYSLEKISADYDNLIKSLQ